MSGVCVSYLAGLCADAWQILHRPTSLWLTCGCGQDGQRGERMRPRRVCGYWMGGTLVPMFTWGISRATEPHGDSCTGLTLYALACQRVQERDWPTDSAQHTYTDTHDCRPTLSTRTAEPTSVTDWLVWVRGRQAGITLPSHHWFICCSH